VFMKKLSRQLVLVFFCVTTLLCPCRLLHAVENKQQIKEEQGMSCCGPEDYTEITPAVLPSFYDIVPGSLFLARYYDDLEPPE